LQRADPATGLLYGRFARLYDVFFERVSLPRWRSALSGLRLRPGARVLEVGCGTGLALPLYPRDVRVTGVDLSSRMLALAQRRVRRARLDNVTLRQLDAQRLPEQFAPGSFDCVVAAFVLSVVPDPLAVLRGMVHVGTPDCVYVVINHVQSRRRLVNVLERLMCPLTSRIGWKSDFALDGLPEAAGLEPVRVSKLHPADLFSILHLRKRQAGGNGHVNGNGHRNGHANGTH